MQAKLERLEQEHGITWQEYRLGDLFEHIVQGSRLRKSDQIPGQLPFVMAGVTNTGIVNHVGNDIPTFPANSLTIDIFGNVFYRSYEYGMGDDTGAYWNTRNPLSKSVILFLGSAIGRTLAGKFDYGYKLRSSRSLDFEVSLPVKTKDGKSEIAFDFMEEFIATLEAERLASLEAYLLATELSNYTLTDAEQAAIDNFAVSDASISWHEYKIGDLFEITSSKRKFNGTYPYVARGESNNGIRGYINEDINYLNPGNTISFGQDTATMFYQPDAYFTGDKIKIFHAKDSTRLNRLTALLFIAALAKAFSSFSWGNNSYKVEILNKIQLTLPTYKNKKGEIAYDLMEDYISAIQKIVIKNVVDYLDTRIDTTQTLISSHEAVKPFS